MGITKRVVSIFLVIFVITTSSTFLFSNEVKVSADTDFVITTPFNGSLRGAGYIDINWTDASSIGNVENYNVYIDGSLVTTTTDTKYEFYTTKVNYHRVWIQANFTDGSDCYTDTSRFGITKKGLAVSDGMGAQNAKTEELGIAWYYNWGVSPFSYSQYSNIEFVPMIWGDSYDFQIKNKMTNAVKAGYKYILGFNEPDMNNAGGGCNKPLDKVISLWPNFYNYDIKVGSPAYSLWSAIEGSEFPQFMVAVDNQVDFVCIHCYPENWNGGQSMANWLLTDVVDDTYNRYHKPIWITEYSTSGNGITQSGTSECIKYFLQGLDERDYVQRQSYFSFNSATFGGGLWNYSTGELSQSGQMYASCGNPTTDYYTGNYVNPRDLEEPTTTEGGATTKQQETTKAVSKPGRAKIISAKNKKHKKIFIKIKRVSGAKGYRIKYSDSRNFNGYWIKNITKRKIYLKKLDKNTKYYIKVRAYKQTNGKKIFGKWSKVKTVKVKK